MGNDLYCEYERFSEKGIKHTMANYGFKEGKTVPLLYDNAPEDPILKICQEEIMPDVRKSGKNGWGGVTVDGTDTDMDLKFDEAIKLIEDKVKQKRLKKQQEAQDALISVRSMSMQELLVEIYLLLKKDYDQRNAWRVEKEEKEVTVCSDELKYLCGL